MISRHIPKFLSLVVGFFLIQTVFAEAGNPVTPILPSDNIQDPGAATTAWGGCGPTDSNCFITSGAGAGSFTTLSVTGNSSIATGAGTTNNFGTGANAANTFGNALGTNSIFGATTFNQATTFATAPTVTAFSTAGVVHNSALGVLSSSQIVNADIANATIDLTTKVTGVLPDANVANNLTINAGAIDATPIGAVTPSTGAFTTLTTTGNTTLGTGAGSVNTFGNASGTNTINGVTTFNQGVTFTVAPSLPLTNGSLWIGNGSGIATAVALSGDATVTNAGVLTIGNTAVTLAKLAADSVNSAKIVDGSVALADLAPDAVDTTKILDATITNADVSATAAIAYTKLALGNSIVLADLTADSVNSAKIVDGSIVAADLANNAVTAAKILDGEITNADINAAAA
ncbi:MAG: hypothetical protein WAX38_00045, partial [Minisyncoccia bacterium]